MHCTPFSWCELSSMGAGPPFWQQSKHYKTFLSFVYPTSSVSSINSRDWGNQEVTVTNWAEAKPCYSQPCSSQLSLLDLRKPIIFFFPSMVLLSVLEQLFSNLSTQAKKTGGCLFRCNSWASGQAWWHYLYKPTNPTEWHLKVVRFLFLDSPNALSNQKEFVLPTSS